MLDAFFPGIVVRTIYGLVCSFLVTMIFTPRVTERLRRRSMGQSVREEGVKAHLDKGGTPTMGGLVMLVAVLTSTLLWASPNGQVIAALAVLAAVGIVGFTDDFLKISRRSSGGLPGRWKLAGQALVGLSLGAFLYHTGWTGDGLFVPLWNVTVPLGPAYVAFVALVVVGASNAVNLTDGLDGLAAGVLAIVFFAFTAVSYAAGNAIISRHIAVPFVPGAGELAVFCATVAGACLGFLWYNSNPATIFMGDTGSLALGGALGAVAVLVRQELLLVVVGGIFVVEALSVIIQVVSYKTRGKRVFRMSPIHHHFELAGWKEQKVVVRFWLITLVLALVGMSMLGLNSILAAAVPGLQSGTL